MHTPIVRTYEIQIQAVANAPDLSVSYSQNAAINHIDFSVFTKLVDPDGSESLSLLFSDLPDGVKLYYGGLLVADGATDHLSATDLDGRIDLGNSYVDHNLGLTLVLPKELDAHFQFGITAQTREQGTDGVTPLVEYANTLNVTNIDYDVTKNVMQGAIERHNADIWSENGSPFNLSDHREASLALNTSGSIINGFLDYNVNGLVGLISDLSITSGYYDSYLRYQADFNSYYNRTTDTLDIESRYNKDYINQNTYFTTVGPAANYDVDLVLDVNAHANLEIEGSVGEISVSEEIFDVNVNIDERVDLLSIGSGTDSHATLEFGHYGSITAELPEVNTSSQYVNGTFGDFDSTGRDKILNLTLDVDDIVVLLTIKINPLHLDGSVGVGPIEAGFEIDLLDFDVFGEVFFEQNFSMEMQNVQARLTYENGASDSYQLGENLGDATQRIAGASALDSNNDGNIDYTSRLDFNAIFKNDTSLEFDIGYLLKLLSAEVYAEAGVTVGLIEIKATLADESAVLHTETGSYNLGGITLFEESFDVNNPAVSADFIA